MSGPRLARRTARTAAWSVLAGLVAARFVSEVTPFAVQAAAGVGVAAATDWFMRWREGARERDEAARDHERRDGR